MYGHDAMGHKNLFDMTKYELHAVELPNIMWAKNIGWWKDREQNPQPRVNEFMMPFIRTLAIKHPEWSFINDGLYAYTVDEDENDVVSMEDFYIFHDREYLGRVGNDRFRGKPAYSIFNHRISDKRLRGNGTRAQDVKKALRIVEREFGRKSYEEKLTEIATKGRMEVEHSAGGHIAKTQTTLRYLTEILAPHIRENFDVFRDIAVAQYGADAAKLDNYADQKAAAAIAKSISSKARDGNALFVLVTNNVYAAITSGSPNVAYHTWTSDTLPDVVRRKIGLLKLVENHNFLADVGFRLSDDTFLITNEAEDGSE